MLYFLGRSIYYIIYKTLYRLKIEGRDNIPPGTGYIIASNHNSYADPPLVGACLKQPVYFMAKKELFKIPVLGWLISKVHAYPVDRSAPRPSSIKKSIQMLREGKVILIFPKGTRRKDAEIQSGLSLLAHKSGVPVVPSRIFNNYDMRRFHPLKYKIGKPVNFPRKPDEKSDSDTYRQFAAEIMDRINSIK